MLDHLKFLAIGAMLIVMMAVEVCIVMVWVVIEEMAREFMSIEDKAIRFLWPGYDCRSENVRVEL